MKVSKSGLFLFELIVVIFLFTVSAAICISIFANSYSFSSQSENLTEASLKAETVSEVFKKTGGDSESIIKAMDSEGPTHDIIMANEDGVEKYTLNFYYDKMWNSTDEHNKKYVFTVNVGPSNRTKTGYILKADITVVEGQENIFKMNTKKYLTHDDTED